MKKSNYFALNSKGGRKSEEESMGKGQQIIFAIVAVIAIGGAIFFTVFTNSVDSKAGKALELGAENSTKIASLQSQLVSFRKGRGLHGTEKVKGEVEDIPCTADSCSDRFLPPPESKSWHAAAFGSGWCTSAEACAIQCPPDTVARLSRKTALPDGTWGRIPMCVRPRARKKKKDKKEKEVETRYLSTPVRVKVNDSDTARMIVGAGSSERREVASRQTGSGSGDSVRIRIDE